MEIFSRACSVSNSSGDVSELTVKFYAPEADLVNEDYKSMATITCKFFEKNVYAIGSDAAQSFFFLPKVTTAYLIGQRRYGYETYWHEKGDLGFADFWTYTA